MCHFRYLSNLPGRFSHSQWKRKTDEASTDFVEGLQVADGRGHGQVVWEFILQVGDQHPELGAPVSHMVQPANVNM